MITAHPRGAHPRGATAQPPSPQPAPDSLSPEAFRILARLARHWLRRGIRRRDAVGTELRRIDPLIDQARETGKPASPTYHPVLRHLTSALEGFNGLELLAQSGPLLSWRDAGGPPGAAPRTQLARAEIIGPEAPLRHPDLTLGFLLVAPHADHAAPGSPATELHHVVSGRALWSVGAATEERRPGDFVLHPDSIRHAIRTADDPLLTIYAVAGNRPVPPGTTPHESV
ncbi:dimethylsulfonioproprionate lyase family protein [Rhodopila globiformis]|nr:dimethylsulfonioproprionate lyase family protein [Rhodopila globiformis]